MGRGTSRAHDATSVARWSGLRRWVVLSVIAVVACAPLGVIGAVCLARAVRASDLDDRYQFVVWWSRATRWTIAAIVVGLAAAVTGLLLYAISLGPYYHERPYDG